MPSRSVPRSRLPLPGSAVGPGANRPGAPRFGPFARANFRVAIDARDIGLCFVSALHWGDSDSDPALRQTVTLRRAVGQDRTLFDWRRAIASGKDDARVVTVVLLDTASGDRISAWELADARALRWSGPELDAFSNEIAFEELEITYTEVVWRD